MFRNIVQVFINVEALLGSLLGRGSIQRDLMGAHIHFPVVMVQYVKTEEFGSGQW